MDKKKAYKQGIVMGILAIVSALLIAALPLESSVLEIVNYAVLCAGAVLLTVLGPVLRKYTAAAVVSGVYLASVLTITMVIELGIDTTAHKMGLGFVPAMIISVTGLITTIQNKGQKKIAVSFILNILGVLLSIAALAMGIIAGMTA